jgi:hypothetical protein
MKSINRLVAALLLALSLCASALAQSSDAPFTDRELAKLIADWPSVVQWLEAKGRQIDAAESAGPAAFAAMMAGSDLEAFLKGKGWTLARFSYVAGTAFMLAAYVTFERQNPDMIRQMDEAIAQVRSNPSLPPADKAQAIQGLEEAKKSMLAIPAEAKLNEAELKLVRARYDALYKVMEESGD